MTDVVPAALTVLVVARPGVELATLRAAITSALREPRREVSESSFGDQLGHQLGSELGREVTIAVCYDGPDLLDVADHLGLTVAEVIAAHTHRHWRVAFTGFVPGFAYLVPLATTSDSSGDATTAACTLPRLHVPRRSNPRTSVPAGSVALAGDYCGIYPRPSPGGWQLIGTTDALLWDPRGDPPALLAPGALVRFIDVESAGIHS